jgi:hypothetical protein
VQLFSGGGYPYLFELATQHVLQPGYDFGDGFDFGLDAIFDAIFDALARALPGSSGPGRGRESSEVLQ